jgi:DNA-binding beta-propeller fold protein YncE
MSGAALRVVTMVHRGKLILAVAAAMACAAAAGLPAAAARPAAVAAGYVNAGTVKLNALPLSLAEDPATNTTLVGEKGKYSAFRTAVVSNRTNTVVATLPVFGYSFGFDSRTGDFYLPTDHGVAVIDGQTHRVAKLVAVDSTAYSAIAVDPRSGHVFVGTQAGDSSGLAVLSDQTNKVIARIALPDLAGGFDPLAASPAHGLIYAGVNPLRQGSRVWVIGARTARVLARVPVDEVLALAVDDQSNLASVMAQGTLTVIDGQTHRARTPVDVTGGFPAGAQAEGVDPATHTWYAAVECDPASWVTAVSEQTGKVVATISTQGALRTLAVDQRRNVVFAVDYVNGRVLVISARTNKVMATLPVGVHPGVVVVNPATGRAYVANSSRTLSVLAPAATGTDPGASAKAGSGRVRGGCG